MLFWWLLPSDSATGDPVNARRLFTLLAVPLFLLMSNVLLKGGVGRDLFSAVQARVGHWPGGLAVATILSCGLFAAISAPRLLQQPWHGCDSLRWLTADTTDGLFTVACCRRDSRDLDTSIDPDDRV